MQAVRATVGADWLDAGTAPGRRDTIAETAFPVDLPWTSGTHCHMLLTEPLPRRMLAWQIKGAGFEHFGVGDGPDEIPFPEYGEDDVVARVDAVGICYSDAKLVRAGAAHARLRGRDLAAAPVTPGHETTLTVVGVGERRRGQIRLGGRYLLQPDVYHRGRSLAVGYQIAGALAEYVVLGREVLGRR